MLSEIPLLRLGLPLDTLTLDGELAGGDVTLAWQPSGVKASWVLDGVDPEQIAGISAALEAFGYRAPMEGLFAKDLASDAGGLEEAAYFQALAAAADLASALRERPLPLATPALARAALIDRFLAAIAAPWLSGTVGGSAPVFGEARLGFSREFHVVDGVADFGPRDVVELWCKEGKGAPLAPENAGRLRALFEVGPPSLAVANGRAGGGAEELLGRVRVWTWSVPTARAEAIVAALLGGP